MCTIAPRRRTSGRAAPKGRGLVWLRELTKRSSAWLIGGDLNTPSYLVGPRLEEATCVFDSGRKPMDLALASNALTPAPVTCEVGKHFGFTEQYFGCSQCGRCGTTCAYRVTLH